MFTSALCIKYDNSLCRSHKKNHSCVFCLKAERQVTLLLLRRAVTVALRVPAVLFTSQFQGGNKKALLNVSSPWVLSLLVPIYV